MRLTKQERQAIKETFIDVFNSGKIYLFGSRVDDSKKGGDIDLYIELDGSLDAKTLLDKKIEFKLKLYNKIGEQKIDIVFAKDKCSRFEQEIIQTRVKL